MRVKADSKRKQRVAALAGLTLLAGAAFAQGMDATDRQDKLDMNREGAASRIERLQADQRRGRQERPTSKKSRTAPKKPQQWLQY